MKTQKNVIIFFSDQQRADTLGINGNPMGLTPNLDRYGREGTNCSLAFTPQPVCLPARAALQTGRYASQENCNTNGDSLKETSQTLAHHFNNAGYSTAYIGKWHLSGTHGRPFEKPQGGYQYWLAENVLEFVSDAYDTVLHDGEGKEHRLPGYRVDAVTDAAMQWIDNNKDKPFYIMVSHLEPHHQNHRDNYPAPYGYEEEYNNPWLPPDLRALGGTSAQHLPGYYGMVKRLDEAYGRLMDMLRSRGLLEDTIVVYTADHGCHFKTRNAEYKRSCHDASIRIPMVLTGGQFTGGGNRNELVNLVDLAPTLLDACNIPQSDVHEGNSLLSVLSSKNTDEKNNWPEYIYSEISESHVGRVVRTHRWKYSIKKLANGEWEDDFLYDLKADPWELTNIIGYESHVEVTAKMRQLLSTQMIKIGQGNPIIHDAKIIPKGQRRVSKEEVDE